MKFENADKSVSHSNDLFSESIVKHRKSLTAVVANASGQIFELDGYNAVGMDGPVQVPLSSGETINMPHGSELMYLPDRAPILYNPKNRQIEVLENASQAQISGLKHLCIWVYSHLCQKIVFRKKNKKD